MTPQTRHTPAQAPHAPRSDSGPGTVLTEPQAGAEPVRLDHLTSDQYDALLAELAELHAFRDVVFLEAEHWSPSSLAVIRAALDVGEAR